MIHMNKKIFFVMIGIFILFNLSFVSAQNFAGSSASVGQTFSSSGSASFTNVQYFSPGYFPGVSGYTGGSGYGGMAYNGISREEFDQSCRNRQDFVVQILPGGCTPLIVRSDLLAEQNVPVFCQLTATQVNPLINTQNIRNIRLVQTGNFSKDLVGVGYYRPQRAIFSKQDQNGFLSFQNIGYAVIILKRQPNEKLQPEFIYGNLTAYIDYGISDQFGAQLNEKLIPVINDDSQWSENYQEYSFLNNRGFLRLEDLSGDRAKVGIYLDANTRIDSVTIQKGVPSGERYLAGGYCNAGYTIELVDSVQNNEKATILLDGDQYDAFEGGKFGDNCILSKLENNGFGTGSVKVRCLGTPEFSLAIKNRPVKLHFDSADHYLDIGDKLYDVDDGESVYLANFNFKKPFKEDFVVLIKAKEIDLESLKTNIKSFTDEVAGPGVLKNLIASAKKKYLPNNEVYVIPFEESGTLPGSKEIGFFGFSNIEDSTGQTSEFEKYFKASIESYKTLEEEYGSYDYPKYRSVPANYDKYGKAATSRAIELAKTKGKDKTELEFAKIGNEKYNLNNPIGDAIESFNYNEANYEFEVDGITHVISLEKITSADPDKVRVIVSVAGVDTILYEPGKYVFGPDGTKSIMLKAFDDQSASFQYSCDKTGDEKVMTVALGRRAPICGMDIFVKDIKSEQLAKLRVTPVQRHTQGMVNLSYGIGVEKRAFPLSPEKSLERIKRLNESIAKLKNINDNLGKLIKAGKTACFATSAVLQVKNLISGLGGGAIAREMVMKEDGGWDSICQGEVAKRKYISLDACFRANSDKIEADVGSVTNMIKQQNEENKAIDNANKNPESGGIFSNGGIDGEKAYSQYFSAISSRYSGSDVVVASEDGKKTINVNEVFFDLKSGDVGREDLREIDLNLRILKESNSDSLKAIAGKSLYNKLQPIKQQSLDNKNKGAFADELRSSGVINIKEIDVISSNSKVKAGKYDGEITDKSIGPNGQIPRGTNIKPIIFDGKEYLLTLSSVDDVKYRVEKVYYENGLEISADDPNANLIPKYFGRGLVRYDAASYRNTYENPLVRYYENEPYKGMPAIVPFDIQNGWYAGTKQTLPVLNNIASYDQSGKVSSFWLCNVGTNGREEFSTGFGDDICEQFNLNTGQPLDQFPGLDEGEASKIVRSALRAIEEAARAYSPGVRKVKILGRNYDVGTPAASTPSAQCQDFMSPKDCQLMFNVCDPVICPSSRCNLGGTYQVDDVVQTGIVGGIFMCLPNYKEGIVVPICLTGVNAGIENFVSILEASRDCLQESVDTGKYVGICDEITAIYKCEFFWNQISPAVNVILPRLLETISGQGSRGGGEYAGVQAAWSNMQNSIDYFKNQYSVNALKAFRVRSTQEVGTPVCKAFISARFPNKFKNLIEPDSPYQFSAWFDEIPFTTATTPSLSQYKVFYHIYAGKDQGIYYSVYMKEPTSSSFIQSTGAVIVDTGFVGLGEYKSEAKDFTAPSGFKQLCVRINGEEKCGFKQVSTSFALNYVRDKYVQDQLNQTNIKTGKECVSGSPGALALVNPNLQSGVEDAATPRIYERGIVRVCSSGNPGSGTDPSRWVEVGYCDDKSISCWLDRESVDKAITPGNIGVKNQSASDLDALVERLNSRDSGGALISNVIGGDDAVFGELEQRISALNTNNGVFVDLETEAKIIFAKISEFDTKYQLIDKDHPRLLFDKAWVYEILARKAPIKSWEKDLASAGDLPLVETTTTDRGITTTPSGGETASAKKSGLEKLGVQIESGVDVDLISPEGLWVIANTKISTNKDLTIASVGNDQFFVNGEAAKELYDDLSNIERETSPIATVASIFPLVSAITPNNFEDKYYFSYDAITIEKKGIPFLAKSYDITIKDKNSIKSSIKKHFSELKLKSRIDEESVFASYFNFQDMPYSEIPSSEELTDTNSKIKFACNYFETQSYSNVHIAGIIGNLMQESNLDSKALGDKKTALGIAQWRNDRRTNLNNFATSKGKSSDDFFIQLEFINHELKGIGVNGGGSKGQAYLALLTTQNIEDSTRIFMLQYERPNINYANLDNRIDYANQVMAICF